MCLLTHNFHMITIQTFIKLHSPSYITVLAQFAFFEKEKKVSLDCILSKPYWSFTVVFHVNHVIQYKATNNVYNNITMLLIARYLCSNIVCTILSCHVLCNTGMITTHGNEIYGRQNKNLLSSIYDVTR